MKRVNGARWTKDEIDTLTYVCNQGATKQEAAEAVGTSIQRVTAKAKALGLHFRRAGHWTKDEEEWLISLAECQMSPARIGEIMNRSSSSVATKALRMGITLGLGYKDGMSAKNARTRWDTDEENELLACLSSGMSVEQCALKMHRSQSSIRNRAYLLGCSVVSEKSRRQSRVEK